MLVTVLVLFGTIMIGSANGWVYNGENFDLDGLMVKQLIGYGLGLAVIAFIMVCDYSFLKLMAIPSYCIVLILLLSGAIINLPIPKIEQISPFTPNLIIENARTATNKTSIKIIIIPPFRHAGWHLNVQ